MAYGHAAGEVVCARAIPAMVLRSRLQNPVEGRLRRTPDALEAARPDYLANPCLAGLSRVRCGHLLTRPRPACAPAKRLARKSGGSRSAPLLTLLYALTFARWSRHPVPAARRFQRARFDRGRSRLLSRWYRWVESSALLRRVSDAPLLAPEPSRSASVEETAGDGRGTQEICGGTDGSNPSPSSRQSVSLPQPLAKVENPAFRAGLASWLANRSAETRWMFRYRVNRGQYLCRAIFQYR